MVIAFSHVSCCRLTCSLVVRTHSHNDVLHLFALGSVDDAGMPLSIETQRKRVRLNGVEHIQEVRTVQDDASIFFTCHWQALSLIEKRAKFFTMSSELHPTFAVIAHSHDE